MSEPGKAQEKDEQQQAEVDKKTDAVDASKKKEPTPAPATSKKEVESSDAQAHVDAVATPKPPPVDTVTTDKDDDKESSKDTEAGAPKKPAKEESSGGSTGAQEGSSKQKLKGMSGTNNRNSLVVKVGLIGDSGTGKTSLMVKYVEGKFDSDYIETLGVNFMEKSITLKNAEVTFSIWDLGGEKEFISMLPLVCNDALVILFIFDLSRRSTLTSVKEWYRQVRGLNKQAFAFLIGTKYDIFATMSYDEQKDITKQARKFAKAMKAPLIFCSASHSINVQKVFKLIFGKVFNVDSKVPIVKKVGDPIIEYSL